MKTVVENIPEFKKKIVKELTELIKNKKTILLASIKDLPASQFQEIGKKLRGIAVVKVPKKNLIFRAITESKNKELEQIKDQIKNSTAFLFSDLDSYELAGELLKNKSPAKARVGQVAPSDIEIEAGPTDLSPGPAISELGSVGLQVQIEKGKITIKESRVIVKEGDKISQNAADVMNKLDIKPFSMGYIPVAGYDLVNNKLYLEIQIDKEKVIEDLKFAYAKALPFAMEIGYVCKETLKLMISKAATQEKRLIRVMSGEPEEAVVEEEIVETPKEEKKEEPKVDAGAGLASLFG